MFMKNSSFFLKGYKRFLLWLLLLYITLSIHRYFTPLQYLEKKTLTIILLSLILYACFIWALLCSFLSVRTKNIIKE